MLRRSCAVIFLIVMAGSSSDKAMAGSPQGELLLPILQILHAANLSGSLEFTRPCNEMSLPDFPSFQAPTLPKSTTVQSLREIFGESAIGIEQDSAGKVRMVEKDVPTDLLNIRIQHISFAGVFSAEGVYTPNDALYVILNAPEVIAFSKAHEIQILGLNNGIGGHQWSPESPHLSRSLENVTLSEALDEVLKTFPGIWVYQNCPPADEHRRIAFIRFFYLRNIGAGVFVEG